LDLKKVLGIIQFADGPEQTLDHVDLIKDGKLNSDLGQTVEPRDWD
jgi:hypothetical protein